MDTGQITNPKDLERMQHELVSLERRITTLEDAELEVMEALEEAQQVLEGLGIRAEDIDARLGELVTLRDEKQAGIDASLAEVAAARGPAVEGMPDDLLALYERLREQKGVGAALLRGAPVRRLQHEHRRLRAVPHPVGPGRRGDPVRGVPAHPGAHRRVGTLRARPTCAGASSTRS